jgi:hypothetical protein
MHEWFFSRKFALAGFSAGFLLRCTLREAAANRCAALLDEKNAYD